jgi:hypothetical protein
VKGNIMKKLLFLIPVLFLAACQGEYTTRTGVWIDSKKLQYLQCEKQMKTVFYIIEDEISFGPLIKDICVVKTN